MRRSTAKPARPATARVHGQVEAAQRQALVESGGWRNGIESPAALNVLVTTLTVWRWRSTLREPRLPSLERVIRRQSWRSRSVEAG